MIDTTKLNDLSDKLSELESVANIIRIKKAAYEESIKDFSSKKKELSDSITELKEALTIEASEEYNTSDKSSKTLLGGLKIRISKILEYDKREALSYAKRKDMFLQLDATAFEKVAAGLDLDFVKENEVIQVTFPKKIIMEDL